MDHVSRNRLRAVGKALQAGTQTPNDERDFERHLQRCDDVLAKAQMRLEDDGFMLNTPVPCAVQGRLKTRITLLEKLDRLGGSSLGDIRDIVGLRVVGDLNLTEQTLVAKGAMEQLGIPEEGYRLIDRRVVPSPGGYRALHVEFRLDGVRGELQVRTRRQHVWAETYERLGDTYGRQIRYRPTDDAPQPPVMGVVQGMENLSLGVRQLETALTSMDNVERLAHLGVLSEEDLAVFATAKAELKRAGDVVDEALRNMSMLSAQAVVTADAEPHSSGGGQP